MASVVDPLDRLDVIIVFKCQWVDAWINSKGLAHSYSSRTLWNEGASVLPTRSWRVQVWCIVRALIVVSRTAQQVICVVVVVLDLLLDILIFVEVIVVIVRKFIWFLFRRHSYLLSAGGRNWRGRVLRLTVLRGRRFLNLSAVSRALLLTCLLQHLAGKFKTLLMLWFLASRICWANKVRAIVSEQIWWATLVLLGRIIIEIVSSLLHLVNRGGNGSWRVEETAVVVLNGGVWGFGCCFFIHWEEWLEKLHHDRLAFCVLT